MDFHLTGDNIMDDKQVLGMLYLVSVRLYDRKSGEKIKHKILVVASEIGDIERKVKWMFDYSLYDQFSITHIEKIRQKMQIISTKITQIKTQTTPVIKQGEETKIVQQGTIADQLETKLFAIALSTKLIAFDEDHALRKLGKILINTGLHIKPTNAPLLSEKSKLIIEHIAGQSGYALPRDVSEQINTAHFVRG